MGCVHPFVKYIAAPIHVSKNKGTEVSNGLLVVIDILSLD